MAQVYLYDEFTPEDAAMLQALYSRSPESVTTHVEKVKSTGSGKFMEKFYVGYGHLSIADCGSTTLFIEGLSILADKAIQDWPLYSGQETSTRYVDMSKQAIIDPLDTPASREILKKWMDFYVGNQAAVQDHIRAHYPQKQTENPELYEKAVKARAFDIMRGFLPAGITTQLSWHTNLRQAWDKLSLMRYHPMPEVKKLAEDMLAKLKEKYPHSFSHPLFEETENYRRFCVEKYNFYQPAVTPSFAFYTTINPDDLDPYRELFERRPPKTNLPNFLGELGQVRFDFLLDYGSFRDVQRHRNGVCRMPLLTTDLGFHTWYLEQLPETIKQQAYILIAEQIDAIVALETSSEIKQYYISLGFNVPCRLSYTLPAAVYVVELRSNKTVHPSLRRLAHKMAAALEKNFPILRLHADRDPDDWDIRRGSQDITPKN
jgi:thymidylate synthase ThyX